MEGSTVEIVFWRSLAQFLLVGASAGIVVALLMIRRPDLLDRIGLVANRWVPTHHLHQALDRSIAIERWCYRHHRLLGAAILLGALYIFIYFGVLFDKAEAMRHLAALLPPKYSPRLLDWLLDALVLAGLSGAAVSSYVGALLVARPSLLKGLEDIANQWLSGPRVAGQLDMPRDDVEAFVARHMRPAGWLLLAGSLALLLLVLRAFA